MKYPYLAQTISQDLIDSIFDTENDDQLRDLLIEFVFGIAQEFMITLANNQMAFANHYISTLTLDKLEKNAAQQQSNRALLETTSEVSEVSE